MRPGCVRPISSEGLKMKVSCNGLTWQDRATVMMAIVAICLSCLAIGLVMGAQMTKELQEPPTVGQGEPSKMPRF